MRIVAAAFIAALSFATAPARAQAPDPADWGAVLAEAKGQTVYFHAWGGEARINEFIEWAADEAGERFGVRVQHVKVSDTAEVVSRVLTEKAAGRTEGGAVDLVWINGENFAAMKSQGLLQAAGWATKLPHYRFVDVENKPTVERDFTVPVDGLEAPWGMAKLVFFHDPGRVPQPPKSAAGLGEWIAQEPGPLRYPQPPDSTGPPFLSSFCELTPDPPCSMAATSHFAAATAPLSPGLTRRTPNLWRSAAPFPAIRPHAPAPGDGR
jgi:putative thiamine transport system substrate-binding protein